MHVHHSRRPRRAAVLLCGLLATVGAVAAQQPDKQLPLPGEVFAHEGRAAFLMLPDAAARGTPQPWVFYAPTLEGLPSAAETWMFERFLAAGVAIAGIDVGESYGSPRGRALYESLYRHLVGERGLSSRPCLLARSRGGLMLYGWAADHPQQVAGIAGIYPVCSLESYPGLARAAAAYELDEASLRAALPQHDPIADQRLRPLVRAGVPVLHLHGDHDRTVPFEANSALLRQRFTALGGNMQLERIEGGGHDMAAHWFRSQTLVDFVIARCKSPEGCTRDLLGDAAPGCPEGALQLVGPAGSRMVPEEPEKASGWQFADGVLTAPDGWDNVVTERAYRDFRLHVEFNVNTSTDDERERRGNSGVYLQQRYELQILDSFGVAEQDYTAADCGSLYRLRKPDRLASRPAGEWQTFDLAFRAARFRGDEKVEPARITVLHNGVRIHDDVAIARKTGAGMAEGPEPRPIRLQGHHNRVRFRNVWVLELELGP